MARQHIKGHQCLKGFE